MGDGLYVYKYSNIIVTMYISFSLTFSVAYFFGIWSHVFAQSEAGHLADTDVLAS